MMDLVDAKNSINIKNIDPLITSLFDNWQEYHKFIPNTLYHYTSAEGLVGILSSQSFWMTELRYMNDLSELQYAINLVRERIAYVLNFSGTLSENAKAFINQLVNINPFYGNVHVYSTSFCEHGNLLSQWRAYRGKGGGYAIGIDFLHTLRFLSKPCTLYKVIYDKSEQINVIDKVINKFIDAISTEPSLSEKGIDQATWNRILAQFTGEFNNVLIEYLPSLKHPDFVEEREWRLIFKNVVSPTYNRTTDHPKFRTFDGNIIPYYAVEFKQSIEASKDDTHGVVFPIVKMNIGPTINSDLNQKSIAILLQTMNPDIEPQITKSEIPLRWL